MTNSCLDDAFKASQEFNARTTGEAVSTGAKRREAYVMIVGEKKERRVRLTAE